jgi:tRNA pseudouridine38-40 synthase
VSLPHLSRVAFVVAYEGTGFAGWQSQVGVRTVQGELELALSTLCGGQRVVVEGSGRTDAGVHALAQVAHADLAQVPTNLRYRLNSMLEGDLRVLGAASVDAGFHARNSTVGKVYRYRIERSSVASPFSRHLNLHVEAPLDLAAMAAAARLFVGERDFASLQSTGSSVVTTRREILRCEIEGEPPQISVVVEGSGFLRHMVRAIVGSLLLVGRGQRRPEWIADVLDAKDRSAAGPNAPAHGLFLESVRYPARWQQVLDASMHESDTT